MGPFSKASDKGPIPARALSYVRPCGPVCKASPFAVKKLQADLDLDPWSWPPASSPSLLAICDTPTPQQDARNGFSTGRKRKLLTFSEITDAFVEGKVRTEKDAWQLAKNRKVSGDETLWNSLGARGPRATSCRLKGQGVIGEWLC